ncbi:MAG: zinc-binding dehydrogenase [Bacteroidetes bacterium]|nr:zinc-binding dehydrogenase [Bacteroidota bacterium]
MKAVVAQSPGGPEALQIAEVDEPTLAAGEVKIRVKAFGLNKAESYYRSGNYGSFVPNRALGIEAVGEVVEDTTGQHEPGRKVATAMGGLMFQRHGGYSEFVVVNASNVVTLDSKLDYGILAALPESYLTVWGALDHNLKITKGQSILVRGATSAVGLAAVAYANARGLTVVATTRRQESADLLKKFGAAHIIIDDGAVADKVRKLYPKGVDGALEVVGAATVKDTLKAVRNWGEVVVIGLLGGPPILESFDLMDDLPNTVKLSFFSSGMLGTESLPLQDCPLDWIAGRIEVGKMPNTVAATFSIDDIQKAHELLDAGTAGGKIVVTI